jgi:hypothetical protein
MRRFVKPALVAAGVLLAAIQLVRPSRTNPPVEPDHALQAHATPATAVGVAAIHRACGDCHSHETRWPWYSGVAPVSWVVAQHVTEGREAVNFSTWRDYPPDRQRKILKEACDEVTDGEMPLSTYRLLHREATLTEADVRAICSLAQLTDAMR